ncbi:putative mannosyltransferase [Nocardia nova SH22a]|uniref:Putative mannosyltransferase n=1 Tax=Nocardia nova SH22a TaxID=1415166 RepID=W5TJX0_9NOCA|nr:glycosyltransferase family 39 protein [Nocardia nova]AHH19454.1 putative mannosyltransferase [Nocardia nova SH22a]
MGTVTTLVDHASVVPPEPARPATATMPGRRTAERAGLAALLIATTVLYLWHITIDGMGNQFYAGAAWAGSKSWEALLFGSLDPADFITVDKPPVSQWVMGLSGRIFGFSSASMLIPQALMAVAAVALLYGAVRRITNNPAVALLAGAALALTPVAALMFRFNNPDAVMVLLMTAAAYATVRALDRASTTWLMLAGAALGFAFLAKMLEGLMVLPALGLAYLVAAPNPLRTRLLQLLAALAALVVSSGWYVVLTLLWPASSRPYLAGSTDNNFMNLVLGYNGFARILGRNHGGGGGHPAAAHAAPAHAAAGDHPGFGGFGGQVHGVQRLFTGEFGFEIGWLLPAALLAFVLVLVSRGRAPRTDRMRAAALIFGGWIIIDGGVLSYMNGMVHPYYCLSIAPAVAGMFAIGVAEMWHRRTTAFGRFGTAALLLVTGMWSFVLLHRNSAWHPELRWSILVVTIVAAVALAVPRTHLAPRRLASVVLTIGLLGSLAGSAAYSFATVATAHSGGGPTVGPAQAGGRGGFGQSRPNPQLAALLKATNTTWAAATNGSSAAAGLELDSDKAVMAIGGFSGSDPVPTLAQFQADVRDGKVAYYVVQADGRNQGAAGRDQDAPGTPGQAGAVYPGGRGTADGRVQDAPGIRNQTGAVHPGTSAQSRGVVDGRSSAHGSRTTDGAPQSSSAENPGGSGGFGRNQHTDITDWVTATFPAQHIGTATVYQLTGYHG